jgi:cytochrome c oxidase subunit 2
MKILLKLFAAAAALGMAPAAASAQAAPAPAAGAAAQKPIDAVSANSQAAPARPGDVSANGMQAGAEPTNAQVAAASIGARSTPVPGIGQPDGGIHLQQQFTPIGKEAARFHNIILVPLIFVISAFVLLLLLIVIVRFRRGANPVPSRNSHNTVLEIVWTLVPVLILVGIAVPSIQLLAHQYSPPKADLTVKVIGNQWYWHYEYPDNGDLNFDSYMLKEAGQTTGKERPRTAADGPRLLAVDERMVVPAGAVVKLIVTSSDVIHSFGVPSFWVKMDAVPGRLNETWFKVDRPGVYYGVCYELCGARHPYMPIAVDVVSPAQFRAWVASKGGTLPGQAKPTSPDATQNSPVSNPTQTAGGSAPETSPPANVSQGTATPPVTSQSQAATSRGQ